MINSINCHEVDIPSISFNHKTLAKVFREKLLAKLAKNHLILPKTIPLKWVVDCTQVRAGDKVMYQHFSGHKFR